MATEQNPLGKNYDRAAWFYETSAALFSFGKIRASKKYAVSQLTKGERVLFLGVGSGEDAVMAAERGAHVSCIDLSRKMLDRLETKLRARQFSATIICGDAFEHTPETPYDAVCAHYFLNVFRYPEMERMLLHAAKLVRPHGKLLIADVAQAQGSWPARILNQIYLKTAMASFWMLGLVPLHRNYDYTRVFPQANLVVNHVRHFRILKKGPIMFQTIVAHKLPSNT